MEKMGARAYHEATRHTPAGVRAGGRGMDWANQPSPFKRYRGLERLRFPPDVPALGVPAMAALRGEGGEGGLEGFEDLARVLWLGAGAHRPRTFPGGEVLRFRTYASAGALYPNEVYVATGRLAGLAPGLFHLDPATPALTRLREGDARPALVRAVAGEEATARARAIVILTAIPWRTAWKYGDRGYRHVFWDAGMILANVLALAASAGIPARIVTAFLDGEVEALLGVDGQRELPVCLVALGEGPEVAPAEAPAEPIGFEVDPVSPREEVSPAIVAANDAGRLDDAEAVRRLRRGRVPEQEGGDGVEPGPGPSVEDDLEEVILRRGSARRFARSPMPLPVLGAVLRAAATPVPSDHGGRLVRIALSAHDVGGLGPGIYRLSGGRLAPVREGSFREEAAFVCLEQRLAADAAACCFLLADLGEVLGAFGDRGYRMAQLEAGVVAGRIHLGAYAHGYGATGLTFYDDEATRLVEAPGAACMLVTCVGESRGRPDLRPVREGGARAAPPPVDGEGPDA